MKNIHFKMQRHSPRTRPAPCSSRTHSPQYCSTVHALTTTRVPQCTGLDLESTVLLHSPRTHHHSQAGLDLESTVLLHSPRTHHHSRAGLDLEDGFGGQGEGGWRAHDLQRRRAHDLQRLGHTICRGGGHTICRGGGHTVLHRRRAHGRRKWFDLFLLSQAQ
jgi:hypothetical protein